jgi:hypothetical protein
MSSNEVEVIEDWDGNWTVQVSGSDSYNEAVALAKKVAHRLNTTVTEIRYPQPYGALGRSRFTTTEIYPIPQEPVYHEQPAPSEGEN